MNKTIEAIKAELMQALYGDKLAGYDNWSDNGLYDTPQGRAVNAAIARIEAAIKLCEQ